MAQNYINKINVDSIEHLIEPTLYVAPTLSSSAYSASLDNFALITGATIQAKFATTNPANATLNINSTGAKNIFYNNAKITASQFKVNHIYTLVYDGTQWQVVGDIDTNTWRGIQDNLTSSTNTTESLSAKQGYLLANGSARDDTKLPLVGGTLTGRVTTEKVINHAVTGSGTVGSYTNSTYYPAKWTFNTGMTAQNGDIVTIKLPCAGHDYGVFMSIDNGTNYYPVVVSGTSRVTTHYPNGGYITVIFNSSGSAASMFALAGQTSSTRITVNGGVWQVLNYYDSGNSGIYQNYNAKSFKVGTTAITAYDLIAEDINGYVIPAHKIAHRVGSPIFIRDSASEANATGSWKSLYDRHYSLTIRKDGNNLSLTTYAPVFLKGTISAGIFTPDTTTPFISTKANCNVSGAYYMYIGDATGGTTVSFNNNHPYYYYDGTNLVLYSEAVPLSGVIGADDLKAIEAISGTSGLLKKTAANTWSLDTSSYVTSSGVTSLTIKTSSPLTGGSNTATTTTGTYTISLADAYGDTKNPYGTKTANYVLAGPTSGNAAAPSFRALVEADLPYTYFRQRSISPATDLSAYTTVGAYFNDTGNNTGDNANTNFASGYGYLIAVGKTNNTYQGIQFEINHSGTTLKYRTHWSSWKDKYTILTSANTVTIAQGGTGATNKRKAGLIYNWTAVIQGQKWSRICYIPYSTLTTGTSFLLNVRATRSSVVYNYTFIINVFHNSSKSCYINVLQGNSYTAIKIRGIADNSGNIYIELYDDANSIASGTTQNVSCHLQILTKGSTEPTLYTTFTDGTTLPDNFTAYELVLQAQGGFQTNGYYIGDGSKLTNLTPTNITGVVSTTAKKFLKDTGAWVQVDWADLTGKPSTFTPAAHTHDYLPVSYIAPDFSVATTTNGAYPLTGGNNPVTSTAEYGGMLQFGASASGTNYYAAQLIVSSASGATSPVHAYIRRMTSTPAWSDWTTLLDNKNTTAPSTVPTLSWNTESTIFTLNGTAVKVKAMAKPTYAFTDLTSHPTTLSGYGITDAKISSGVITLGSNTITPVTKVNGHTGSEVTVTASDLGLSSAMHFLGVSTTTITDGGTENPTIGGTAVTTKAAGDVVIDNNSRREYVWSTTNKWEMLGFDASTAYSQTTSGNTFISSVSQTTDGTVTAGTRTLDTSGTWSGIAEKANKDASGNTITTSYVPMKSGANDVNTIVNTGIYNITSGSATNTPKGWGYGQLLTMSYRKHTGNTTTDWASQIYLHNGGGTESGNATQPGNVLYYRTSHNSSNNIWFSWRKAVHVPAAYTAIGNSATPVYISQSGEAITCTDCAAIEIIRLST